MMDTALGERGRYSAGMMWCLMESDRLVDGLLGISSYECAFELKCKKFNGYGTCNDSLKNDLVPGRSLRSCHPSIDQNTKALQISACNSYGTM